MGLSFVKPYIVSLGIVVLATLIQLGLLPYIGAAPFLLFYPAVILSALVGDGLTGILFSALATQYFFIEPKHSLAMEWPSDYLRMSLFLLAAFMIRQVTTRLSTALRKQELQKEATEKSEKWLAMTLRSIGDAVIATDEHGRVTLLNSVAEQLTEWTLDEAKGRPLSEVFNIVNQQTRQQATNPVDLVLSEGRTVGLANHTVLIGRRGRESVIEDSAAPIKVAGSENILGVVLVFRDVTQKYQSEKELKLAAQTVQYSQERMERLLNNALDAVIEMDNHGIVTQWNMQAESYFGYTKSEAIGRRLSELIIPEKFREAHEKGMARYLATGLGPVLNRRIEVTALRRTGEEFPVELTVTPIEMPDRILFAAFLRDISEQKRLQRDLLLKREALENSLNGFDIVNEQGKFVYANRAYLDMWGYERAEEVLGTSPEIHCADPATVKTIIGKLKTEGACDIEFLARRRDGSTFDVRMLARRAFDADGNEVYPTTSIDITDLKLARKEMQLAKEAAERANLAKSQFLANMSHEIRTPIGVIQGFAEVLSESSNLSEEQRTWLETIRRNTRLLTSVIGEILDLSRIEAGMLEVQNSTFSLREVVDELSSSFTTRAKEKSIQLEFTIAEGTPQFLYTDATRLRQVLINLIGNAIKFTDRGTIKVEFWSKSIKESTAEICVRIHDSGIGMTEEQQLKIFQPFVQADSSTTRKYGGTGLGLAIAKRLALAMRGDLRLLKSSPNQGTTFEFTFSCAVAEPITDKGSSSLSTRRSATSTAKEERITRSGKILLVEDSRDNQVLISNYLKNSGLQLVLASSGLEGLSLVRREKFDLILLDIQMPGLDGYATLTELRKMGIDIPIVALTAHALTYEKEKALSAGFTDFLTKPIGKKTLLDKVDSVLQS